VTRMIDVRSHALDHRHTIVSTSAQLRRAPGVSTIGRRLKAAGAAMGAAVILGMGAFSVTATDSAAIATGPEIVGQTITQTPPPREPQTAFARPTMTAPRFGGWCLICSSNAAVLPERDATAQGPAAR
jgi:hypothetical protein